MYNIIKCPVTVHTVCSCRPLSYLSVVFFKMSSVRIFPLSENIFVQEMRRKYLIVIGRPGPKIQHAGPAEHLSDVNQLETHMQREQEVPCANSPHTDSSTRERQALK